MSGLPDLDPRPRSLSCPVDGTSPQHDVTHLPFDRLHDNVGRALDADGRGGAGGHTLSRRGVISVENPIQVKEPQ
jgi:hypothetical protein